MINYLALIVSIAIAGVAAWYSIIGLMAIFAAAAFPIAVMGGVLEVGKLVTASWLYQNWKQSPFLLKSYLTLSVIVLMFITSMGIFGYLSKAHIDQGADVGTSTARIERLEQQIEGENTKIKRAQDQIAALDTALNKYIELGAVTKSLKAREDQKEERKELDIIIQSSYTNIDELNEQIYNYRSEVRAFEVEVGPIKYIAELIYGDNPDLEGAVRAVIIVLIFVFDPLAVLLLVAANMGIKKEIESRPVPRRRGRPPKSAVSSGNKKELKSKPKKGIIEINKDSVMKMK